MRIEFSYRKNGEVKQCKFVAPERINQYVQQYRIRFIVRMMMNYVYDHEIEKQDWIEGCIYDNDTCLGQIDYLGNFINQEEK